MTIRAYDRVAHHARVRGSKVAVTDLATDRRFTYSQLEDRSSRLARVLAEEFGIGHRGVNPGYWNRPEATEESITDGWLHTGDAAREDEDGFIYIVDRWKDMYISGGENVYPAEVENVIYQLPAVSEVAVVGIPDQRWVEVGKAFVVLKPGENVTEEEIVRHCRQNLARYKVPRAVQFMDELPHNATGKILERELRLLDEADAAQH